MTRTVRALGDAVVQGRRVRPSLHGKTRTWYGCTFRRAVCVFFLNGSSVHLPCLQCLEHAVRFRVLSARAQSELRVERKLLKSFGRHPASVNVSGQIIVLLVVRGHHLDQPRSTRRRTRPNLARPKKQKRAQQQCRL